MKQHKLLSTLLLVLAMCGQSAFAQLTSGNITGTVSDQSGAAIPNAKVVAKNSATGVENTTNSSSSGTYQVSNLPAGSYIVTTNAAGFSSSTLNGVNVDINRTVTANVELQVGKSSTSVEVTEAAAPLDTTTAQIQSTFESKQITDLPGTSTGAGVLNLSLLAPGVASSGAVGSGTGPSVGGQRPRNNNFTIEGIDNNSGSVTGPLVTVPQDAVAEFTLVANQFSAEFGHSSGGQFNQTVKSGTNEFHGSLYEYFQNRNLNAADNLSAVDGTPLHPRFDNNRFGGSIGGPIIKNKLFFFADYEYNPIGQAGSAGLLLAPTQAGYNTIAGIPGISPTNLSIFKQYLGVAPVGNGNVTVGPGVSYAQQQNPATAQQVQVGQVSIPTPNYSNNEYGVGSIDYNLSDKDSMRGRFILNRTGAIDTSANLPTFFENVPTNEYLATFSEYHSFSATAINEFRLGYNRSSNITPVGNQTFPGLGVFPNIQIQELGVQIGPDPNAPQYGYQNTYQLTDNFSWNKGAHSLKFGFDGVRNISPQSFTQRSRGDYEWNTLSDYLFDYTPDYLSQRSAGNPIYWGNRWLFGFYANDNWKVRPNLSISLGVRYEYDTVPNGEQQQSLNAIASVPGLINFQAPSAQTNNIMPRIGIAYTPGSDGRTVIRSGFGINYDVLFDNLGLLSLPPQLSTTQDNTAVPQTAGFLASGGLPSTGPSANFTAAQARAATSGFVPNVKRPEALQWNFEIEHRFGSNYVFTSRYLGTRGIHLPVQDQINRQPVVTTANALPVYFTAPSQATLDSLPNTLSAITTAYKNGGSFVPSFYNAGFQTNSITSYQPIGSSTYHGFANQLTRSFSNGLQLNGSYTWSHDIDDSTAEVFSTYSTPRRPQDSQNLSADRSSSALDHRNRLTLEVLYDFLPFKNSNWFMKNLVGNWEIAPIYTYQTGTYYTVQSGVDSNRNGDSAPDRAIVNPNGGATNVGSGTTALMNSAGQTVGYQVNNPAALYVAAPLGTLSTAGRNTNQLNPEDNIDITAAKRISFKDRASVEFSARIFNVLNHSQYTGGYLSNVQPNGATNPNQLAVFQAGSSIFGNLSQAFSSNPRSMVLALKFLF